MEWERHSADWPMAEQSQFILCKPHLWHVQIMGEGPELLLIHGAGGATQSWRHLAPILAQEYKVIAVDLPGQGFTKLGAQQRCGLAEMAEDLSILCREQGWAPHGIIGHSAGAAIALQMADANVKVVGINAALGNFQGLAGVFFPIMAKTLAMLPMVPDLFSATSARGNTVGKLLDSTGSVLETEDLRFYKSLIADRIHVGSTLQMMAQWNLDPLINVLPAISCPTLLIAGSNDRMVPPKTSETSANSLPNGAFSLLKGLGHLAHEESPEDVSVAMESFLRS